MRKDAICNIQLPRNKFFHLLGMAMICFCADPAQTGRALRSGRKYRFVTWSNANR